MNEATKTYCRFRSLAAPLFGTRRRRHVRASRAAARRRSTVNHVGGVRSGVAGTYNRSELMDERKSVRMLGDARSGHRSANVVSLPLKRRRK